MPCCAEPTSRLLEVLQASTVQILRAAGAQSGPISAYVHRYTHAAMHVCRRRPQVRRLPSRGLLQMTAESLHVRRCFSSGAPVCVQKPWAERSARTLTQVTAAVNAERKRSARACVHGRSARTTCAKFRSQVAAPYRNHTWTRHRTTAVRVGF